MRIKKKMRRIVKAMRRLEKNYIYLSEKDRHDFFEVIKMAKKIADMDYPHTMTVL